MASQIDPTPPADGTPAVKADLRANLAAAKDESEALQSGKASVGHVHALAERAVDASRDRALADAENRMLRVDAVEDVALTVPTGAGPADEMCHQLASTPVDPLSARRPGSVTTASKWGGPADQTPAAQRWPLAGDGLYATIEGADGHADCVFTNSQDTRCGFRAGRDCN